MSLPTNWQPSYDEERTRYLVDRYKGQSHLLGKEGEAELQQHAEAYGIPFYTGDFSILEAIKQAGAGFVEGFTTLNIADHPDNEYEQIFRNLGHLAGFAPGIIAGPAKLLPAKWIGARTLAASTARLKSLPMLGADVIEKYSKQAIRSAGKGFVGRSDAMKTTKNFLLGDKAKHIMQGAFHLGTASALSSWQGGVDQMLEAAKGGAVAGGVFRAIGNLSPGTSAHERMGKAMAGSLFMGLPATMRGATTPEQVYEYVMGAYFGGNEVSWTRAKAGKFVKGMQKWATDKNTRQDAIKSGMDPEFHPKFDALPEQVKPLVKEEAAKAFNPPEVNIANNMAYELATKLGLTGHLKEAELIAEGAKPTGEYRDGEAVYRFNESLIAEKFKTFQTSGGTRGDNVFAKEADKVGIPTVHYGFGQKGRRSKATGFHRILDAAELQEAEVQLKKAETVLKRASKKESEDVRNLRRSNWYKVKWADSVYVIGDFQKGRHQLAGMPGIAAQMAINNGKKVFAFSQKDGRWFEWRGAARGGKGTFIEAGKPPRPTMRFAGIADDKISHKGKQAIKTLFSENYVQVPSVTESVSKGRKSKKLEQKVSALRDELDVTQELYNEKKDDILLKKAAGQDTTVEEVELAQIAQESKSLAERHNRLVNFGLATRTITPEVKNKEGISNEISDISDVDFEGPVNLEVGKVPLQFTSKHLDKVWSGDIDVLQQQNVKRELSQLVEQTLLKTEDGTPITQGGNPLYLRPGSKENLSERWADAVEREIKDTYDSEFTLTKEARRDMRKWMTRKNLGRIVTHLQSDGKTIRMMENPNAPITLAGNRKHQEEPLKRIEEAYMEAGGQSPAIEPIYMVLDHVTIEGKRGRRDLDISDYRNKNPEEFKSMMTTAMVDMGKRGYYPLGGKGDSDRIIWAKHHPQTNTLTESQIKSTLSKFKLGKGRDVDENYNLSEKEFNKMVLSNVYYDLQMNGMQINDANIKTLLTHPGFIKDSAAFNKRQQIWMNNAWSGDVEFIKKQGIKLNDADNYNYLIVKDLSDIDAKLDSKVSNLKNSQLPENVDGAIIVSDKVLNAINADFGNPPSGQNKSFIVSPNIQKGALLGKYMMHAAGPKMSKAMDAKGVHMIMQESAVKQRGLRKVNDYSIEKGELKFTGFMYNDLSPEHIKGNFGVYGNEHFIQNQRIPKQLLQALLPSAWNPVKPEVIDDAFKSIIRERWQGKTEVNNQVREYLDKIKTTDISQAELLRLEKEIINRIEDIGVMELVDAMKSEHAPNLNEAIYNKILKLDKNNSIEDLIEKNANPAEYDAYNNTLTEFNSIVDRVLLNANEWASSQRRNGIDANVTSVYMHKFVRDFRIKAVQNFIINSATKPKRDNSAVGFMRPYDKAMRLNLDGANPRLKELEKNDEIFFLDNAFKELYVKLDMPGKPNLKGMKLEALWNRYEKTKSKKEKEYIEDVFEAISVRVPMDSMSGAQILKFAGFTGREGHGILMHGRSMRAQGGADLDGDKSFVFFGGRGGMKKEWKDAYKNNKKEFYYTEKGIEKIGDNKGSINPFTNKPYREELAISLSKEERAFYTSKEAQYSPLERLRISNAAVDGRNQLGPAVVAKQVMSAAYNAIEANGGTDYLTIRMKTGKKTKKGKPEYGLYRLELNLKNDKKSKEHQRNLGRAQIGLASDPLDELGLRGNDAWFKSMWQAHFNIKDVKRMNPKTNKFNLKVDKTFINKNLTAEDLTSNNLRKGVYGSLMKINQAYWGKNWAEGRKFSMEEILDKGEAIRGLSDASIDASFLGRTGQLLRGLDWSDSVFGKIEHKNLDKAYAEHNARLSKYDGLKNILGRSTFRVVPGNIVNNVMNPKYSLWTAEGVVNTASNLTDFQRVIKGTKYHHQVHRNLSDYFNVEKKKIKNAGHDKHFNARRDLLIEMRKEAEDFVINDMTDIATIMEVSRIYEDMVNNKDKGYIQLENVKEKQLNINQVVEMIHKKVESLKRNSYLMARDRGKMKSYEALIDKVDVESNPGRKLVKLLEAELGIGRKVRTVGEDRTAELDQMQIDNKIIEFKQKLTPRGQKLFDHLMLGSLNRGEINAINEFENSVTKWDSMTRDVIKGLRKAAARTSISRLGFNSNAIPDVSIKEHIGAFANNFKQTYRPLSKEQSKIVSSEVENYKTRIETLDTGLVEALTPSGYQGLKAGKLDAESKKIVTEIADLMADLPNYQKELLPYIVRNPEIIGKDLNAMNKQDFLVLRNYLNSLKGGTWLQRMFSKPGPVELSKRHHALFPKTVNRELMRDDLVMMKEKGFFIDGTGLPRVGQIVKPTHYVDIVQNFIAKMNGSAVNVSDKYIKQFNESMLFHSGLEDSAGLWEIAIRKREASEHAIKVISDKYKANKTSREAAINERRLQLGKAEREYDWANKKNKEYTVTVDGVRQTLTGTEIVNRINTELTGLFKEMMTFIHGKEGALDAYQYDTWELGQRVKRYDYKTFMKDLQNHIAGNTPKGWIKEGIADVPSYFGVDGLRLMAREMQLDMIKDPEVRFKIMQQPATEFITGNLGESYFPHMFFDKVTSKKLMNDAMKKILETPESQMTEEQKRTEIRKLYYKNKSLGGEMRFQDLEQWDLVYDVLDDIAQNKKVSNEKIKWFNANERSGSMKTREVNMGGYSTDPAVIESYVRSLSNTYHRQLSQMFGRWSIDKMYGQMRGKWGQEQTTAWQNFMRLFVQDAIGNPSIIPERLYEDPKMKIKGTPYGWWADNRVKKRLNKIGESLGIVDKKLPEQLRGVDEETLRHWSNLEAQYEMATLLAHPKSMVANIFGGTSHTIQSAGWGNFVKARTPNFLAKINPNWKTMKDVDDFVVAQGVLPEYLVYEMGLQKEFQNTKGKGFLADLTSKLARDPEMSEQSITDLAGKYGLKDKVMNFASKFMSVPERMLRRDAFMAHYVHAWEKFGGAIKEYDHPFLIEMAKKGVKATQFLYNAPFRPAFARTALGKIMTRFQLWGWNSVRFRNDVHRQAKIYGFTPGTEAWKRYERTMQTDLFVFALANVFAYSLFESNLPQPWGWIQDYSDWIFGDEGDRDKAFYGAWPKQVAPLQMVTPPGLRLVGPTFNAMLNDDWSKVSQYYAYTMLPFGRMIRDVNPYAKGNLIENPMRLPEKLFGLPVMQLQRNITEWKEEKPEKLYPG